MAEHVNSNIGVLSALDVCHAAMARDIRRCDGILLAIRRCDGILLAMAPSDDTLAISRALDKVASALLALSGAVTQAQTNARTEKVA